MEKDVEISSIIKTFIRDKFWWRSLLYGISEILLQSSRKIKNIIFIRFSLIKKPLDKFLAFRWDVFRVGDYSTLCTGWEFLCLEFPVIVLYSFAYGGGPCTLIVPVFLHMVHRNFLYYMAFACNTSTVKVNLKENIFPNC